jgi:trehalose/maltose hydrolase-like predicted phosphorylase
LASSVWGGVLARLDVEASWQRFLVALESDVGDVQGGTTKEGIHMGVISAAHREGVRPISVGFGGEVRELRPGDQCTFELGPATHAGHQLGHD